MYLPSRMLDVMLGTGHYEAHAWFDGKPVVDGKIVESVLTSGVTSTEVAKSSSSKKKKRK